ncbi:MAG: TolC family protein, partial [Elusimicrobiota bacterium]
MKIKLFFGVWIAILSVVSAARASLKEVVDIAYENRHEVEISKKQVYLTRWRQINAARQLGPALVLEYKKSEGETLDDPYRAQSYGLRFEQSLFQGGRKYYTYKREQTARKVAEYSQERVKQEIMQEAADNYYRVKMNNSIVGTYERALPQIQSEYEVASNKYSSEALTELDFEEISNIREIIDVRKNMAEDDLLIAKMELKSALGLDEIPDMDYGEFKDIPEKKDLEYSRSECIDIALQNRPE